MFKGENERLRALVSQLIAECSHRVQEASADSIMLRKANQTLSGELEKLQNNRTNQLENVQKAVHATKAALDGLSHHGAALRLLAKKRKLKERVNSPPPTKGVLDGCYIVGWLVGW